MSLDQGAGAVTLSDGNSGATDPGNDNGGNNSGAGDQNQGASFLAALSEDNRKYAETKGWKDPDAQLKSYRDLERAYSQLKSGKSDNQQPKGEQTGDDQTQQPTVPKSAADYQFKLPKDFPQEGFYDKQFAGTFAEWAFEAGLSADQAQKLHDKYVSNAASLFEKANSEKSETFAKSVDAAFKDLTKAWGNADTPQFKRSLELARRAMSNLDPDLKSALEQTGAIGKDAKGQDVVVNSAIFKALAKVGDRLYSEDSLYGAPSTNNPFDTKKPDLRAQGELITKNPELAKTLIEAADNPDWKWWVQKNFPTKR